jgi:hypothetical protein
MISQGLPASGSIALGLKITAVGWTFAAVAAFVAQLTESATTSSRQTRAILTGLDRRRRRLRAGTTPTFHSSTVDKLANLIRQAL